jgi:hypothetical protein
MIKVFVTENSRYAPVVVCDICNEIILDVRMAAVVNQKLDTSESTNFLEVLHAHKGNCLNLAEKRFGGREKTGWTELQSHLQDLIRNVGITTKDFMDWDNLEENIGRL